MIPSSILFLNAGEIKKIAAEVVPNFVLIIVVLLSDGTTGPAKSKSNMYVLSADSLRLTLNYI